MNDQDTEKYLTYIDNRDWKGLTTMIVSMVMVDDRGELFENIATILKDIHDDGLWRHPYD